MQKIKYWKYVQILAARENQADWKILWGQRKSGGLRNPCGQRKSGGLENPCGQRKSGRLRNPLWIPIRNYLY